MTDRGHIIVPQQDQIEVYAGDTGYIVIKQTSAMDPDAVIWMTPAHAEAMCKAIMEAKFAAEQYRAEWIAEGDDVTAT